jgi:hypothetical protein
MTEQEWLECTDPTPMLEFLRQILMLTPRKWRLFGVACCHRINHLLTDERSRRAVAVAERFADGEATAGELDEAFEAAFDVGAALAEEKERNSIEFVTAGRDPLRSAAWAASDVAHLDESADGLVSESANAAIPLVEENAQANLLHDVFGNPFRPVTINPDWLAWKDGTIRRIAQNIYKDRAFDRMPILADALEDAGCADESILRHCRAEGPHVRGCHILDVLLGKE